MKVDLRRLAISLVPFYMALGITRVMAAEDRGPADHGSSHESSHEAPHETPHENHEDHHDHVDHTEHHEHHENVVKNENDRENHDREHDGDRHKIGERWRERDGRWRTRDNDGNVIIVEEDHWGDSNWYRDDYGWHQRRVRYCSEGAANRNIPAVNDAINSLKRNPDFADAKKFFELTDAIQAKKGSYEQARAYLAIFDLDIENQEAVSTAISETLKSNDYSRWTKSLVAPKIGLTAPLAETAAVSIVDTLIGDVGK